MHHGDNRVNRGGPPAFWEVLERNPSTGFIVQRLTDELDGGEVLFRGNLSTQSMHITNRVNLYERSNVYLKKVIRDVARGQAKAEEPHIYDRHLHKNPQLHATALYVAKTALMFAKRLVQKVQKTEWHWGVAYTFGDWHDAVLWRAKLIPNPPARFLADPFAFVHEGHQCVFLEDYCYTKRRGAISVYQINRDGPERLGIILDEPFHLSFPFVFRHEGEIYMIPESSANKDIRLYRCIEFPMRWEFVRSLVTDIVAVDSVVFEKEGRWWMLTTVNPGRTGNTDSDLHLYSSDSPLNGWKPHPGNPLMVDASRGRNGGLLHREGSVYRVAQRHGFGEYGVGATIYRIDSVADGYRETRVQDIEPLFFPGIRGTHHLHHDSGLVVFDFVKQARPD